MAYINFHTHQSIPDKRIISIENVFPQDYLKGNFRSDYLSVGIHPWFIQADQEQQMTVLKTILKDERVVCIGEAGLDKRQGGNWIRQEAIFSAQISLSEEFNKPLVIHCVKAYNEIISLRKKGPSKMPWIFHGFSSSIPLMEQAVEAGFYVSFGAALLKDNSKASASFREAPLDRCFLETDEADIRIEEIYLRAAKLKCCHVSEIEEQMEFNLKLLIK